MHDGPNLLKGLIDRLMNGRIEFDTENQKPFVADIAAPLAAGKILCHLNPDEHLNKFSNGESLVSTKITVNNNGSLKVEGEITVCDIQGNAFDLGGRTTIWFCRCGHSQDKPFCDGSHRKAGFQSEIKARQLPPPTSKA